MGGSDATLNFMAEKSERPTSVWIAILILAIHIVVFVVLSQYPTDVSLASEPISYGIWQDIVIEVVLNGLGPVCWALVIILIILRKQVSRWLLLASALLLSLLILCLESIEATEENLNDPEHWIIFGLSTVTLFAPLFIAVRLLFFGKGAKAYFGKE